jgi:hypothetical protein
LYLTTLISAWDHNVFQKVKVDRKAVAERYRETIEAIYAPAAPGGKT